MDVHMDAHGCPGTPSLLQTRRRRRWHEALCSVGTHDPHIDRPSINMPDSTKIPPSSLKDPSPALTDDVSTKGTAQGTT